MEHLALGKQLTIYKYSNQFDNAKMLFVGNRAEYTCWFFLSITIHRSDPVFYRNAKSYIDGHNQFFFHFISLSIDRIHAVSGEKLMFKINSMLNKLMFTDWVSGCGCGGSDLRDAILIKISNRKYVFFSLFLDKMQHFEMRIRLNRNLEFSCLQLGTNRIRFQNSLNW